MNLSDGELRQRGASLREIDPSALQTDPEDGSLRWFQGEQGTELFLWARLEGVDHAQMVLGEGSIEWSARGGLTTGSFSGGGTPLGGRNDSYLVRPFEELDTSLCSAALVVLEASDVARDAAAAFVAALRLLGSRSS